MDWSTIKIEQREIPKATRTRGVSPAGEFIKNLNVNDCFEVPVKHAQNIRTQFRKVLGLGAYSERTGDEPETVRFWRVK